MNPGSHRDVVIAAAVVIYVIATTVLTLFLRSRTSKQFMVGGRTLPAAVVGVLLMSEFIGAKSTVGTAQEAFERGMAAGWSVLAASIGFALLALFFARQIHTSNQHTISGLVEQRFGAGARTVVSVLMIYALLLVNVGNYVSGAAVLTEALHINTTTSIFVVAAFSAVYYVFGGLKGIAYVTVLHSLLKLLAIAVLVWVAGALAGGITPMIQALPPSYFTWDGQVGGATILAWVVGTVGTIFSTQFIIQAIAASRTPAAARGSALIASLLCLPLGFALAFVGVAARYLYPAQPSLYALPMFISNMETPLAALVTVSLVASVLVSVSTVALAITSLVMRDFYVPWRRPDSGQELRATRGVALVVGLVPLLCVIFTPHILTLSFFTRALRLSIAMVALIGVYLPWLGSARTAVAALIVSGLATTAWYLLGNPFGIDNIYIAAVTPAIVLVSDKVFSGKTRANSTPRPETTL
jgi:solute:Na+ symporter, SSS family